MEKTNNIYIRIALILLFYLINFGLWELIAPVISGEWASFAVYVILFLLVIIIFYRELKNEWTSICNLKLVDKKYYLGLIIALVINFILG